LAKRASDASGTIALSDRLYDRIPLSPFWTGTLVAAALLFTLIAITVATGDLARLFAREEDWWNNRDARVTVLLSVLFAYLPLARRAVGHGARANLVALRDSLEWGPDGFEAALRALPRASRRSRITAGSLGVLAVPLTALLIDRDPGLYFRSGYWGAAQLWMFGFGAMLCWMTGTLFHAISFEGRRLSAVARAIPHIDLLDRSALAPFARQGLLSSLPGVILLSFLALNLGDQGWLWAAGLFGPLALAWTTAVVLVPMRGVHERLQRAKRDELSRVNAAIRGDAAALVGTAIARRAASAGLADLITYRRLVEAVPEWPLDPGLRARLLLYVALPLGSWLGGALVERLIDAALS
jgi:hypothetical protein